MISQQLFDIVVVIAGFLSGWVLNRLANQVQKIEDKLNEVPVKYVSKDDYRADIAEIKETLKQIFDKLDQKVSKD